MKMRSLLACITVALANPALACSPAPSCWVDSSPEYLKDICKGYDREHRSADDIKGYVEEPEKVPAFIKACAKLHVFIRS